MLRNGQKSTEAEPQLDEINILLAQARALVERVEKLPDGSEKNKLRAALSELDTIADEIEPDARPTD